MTRKEFHDWFETAKPAAQRDGEALFAIKCKGEPGGGVTVSIGADGDGAAMVDALANAYPELVDKAYGRLDDKQKNEIMSAIYMRLLEGFQKYGLLVM